VVNPESPDVPQGGFTVHVECDDKARDDIVIPKTGTGGTPVVIDGIEAGSTCIVTEVNPPAGVSYTPLGVNTTGVVVDDEQTVAVTITNPFTIPGGQTVTPAVEAVHSDTAIHRLIRSNPYCSNDPRFRPGVVRVRAPARRRTIPGP
jgi:hypothetical protein